MTERIFHSTTVVLPSGPAREAWVVLHGDRIASVVEALKEKELFAHITLQRSERSKVAELVTHVLDEPIP